VKLRVGTRKSPLARIQTRAVCDALQAVEPAIQFEVVALETSGDRIRDRPLRDSGGKGLFVKELDEALCAGAIDCAVHSLKDLPSILSDGVALAAVPARADARDALVTVGGVALEELAEGARVGTSSPRRAAQLLALRPDLEIELLRGNVETRLRRIVGGDFDATLLAVAGLERLALELRPAVAVPLDPETFVPAPGQGALGVTAREGDAETLRLLARIEDAPSRSAAEAERGAARALGGSCWLPVGAYARADTERVRLSAVLASPDGRRSIRRGGAGEAARAERIGRAVGEAILEAGGREIVDSLQHAS
jgi:hydroxymethylbilane synthase